MPVVRIQLMVGREYKQLADLMQSVSKAVETSLDVPSNKVHVILEEVPEGLWAIGGKITGERTQQRDQPGHGDDTRTR